MKLKESLDHLTQRFVASALLVGILSSCEGVQSVLGPSGPAAEQIAELWWLMFGVATAVVVIVTVLLLLAIFWPRQSTPWGGTPFIVVGGIVLPAVILVGLLIYTFSTMSALAAPSRDALTIEVIGHRWWWEVRYPEEGVTTANELHVPAGQPVRLEVTAADVIHSFWVPELNGKMDLIPGQTNTFWIEAYEPGVYRGQCAEYCGTQHAKMAFLVVSEPQAAFDAWLEQQQQPAPEPTSALVREGQQIFLGSACVSCHTIEGTNASGNAGPDLTHLANRLTLGAGTISNSRANLAGWIVNSQAIKPGNKMPPMNLNPEDLQALLAYLESLE